MRLDFNGGVNPDLYALKQFVPVAPGIETYRLQASHLRPDQIATLRCGLRFLITDANHGGAVDVFLPNGVMGSAPWQADLRSRCD